MDKGFKAWTNPITIHTMQLLHHSSTQTWLTDKGGWFGENDHPKQVG